MARSTAFVVPPFTTTLEATRPAIVKAFIIVMRFFFGATFGGLIVALLAMGGIVSVWFSVGLPLAAGILGAIFGDPFLIRFLHVFRWIR